MSNEILHQDEEPVFRGSKIKTSDYYGRTKRESLVEKDWISQ